AGSGSVRPRSAARCWRGRRCRRLPAWSRPGGWGMSTRSAASLDVAGACSRRRWLSRSRTGPSALRSRRPTRSRASRSSTLQTATRAGGWAGCREGGQTGEERHFSVWASRWAATLSARRGDGPDASACADALARIAATTGDTEAVAALAHALGELALLNGDADGAVQQFAQALELLAGVPAPHDRAETQVRAAAALAAAGSRQEASDRRPDAHPTAPQPRPA